MKTYKEFKKSICEYDDRTDQYVGDEMKKEKSGKYDEDGRMNQSQTSPCLMVMRCRE